MNNFTIHGVDYSFDPSKNLEIVNYDWWKDFNIERFEKYFALAKK
jgi:hypothetical protein